MAPIKRKSFTVREKLVIIDQRKASNLTGRAFSKSVGVSESTVRLWMAREAALRRFEKTPIVRTIRKIPRKRVGFHPEVDRQVLEWVRARNELGIRVKDRLIMAQALIVRDRLLAQGIESGTRQALKDFEASQLWCARFKQRNNLCSRRHTTSHRLPHGFKQLCIKFIEEVHQICTEQKITREGIINLDQVPRYFEAARSTTITAKGSKNVLLGKCQNTHKRFTFTPFVSATGKVLLKHALFSKITNIPKHHERCRVSVNGTGMWNETILKKYIDESIRMARGIFSIDKALLFILDSYTVHVKFVRLNKDQYATMNVFFAVIPPNLTGILQPLDVAINRSFQQYFNDRSMEYQCESLEKGTNKTKSGNIKMPSTELVTTWVVEWCDSLTSQHVSNSFDLCGLVPPDEFAVEKLHKPLKDIFDENITVEQWLRIHSNVLEANQLDYDGGWDFFEGEHAFFSALAAVVDCSDAKVWIEQFILKVCNLLAEDPLTKDMFDEEEKKVIKTGNTFTHGRLEIYAAATILKTQLHLIAVNEADVPTSRVVFGTDSGDDPTAFYYKSDPLIVMVPHIYDPATTHFIDINDGPSDEPNYDGENREEIQGTSEEIGEYPPDVTYEEVLEEGVADNWDLERLEGDVVDNWQWPETQMLFEGYAEVHNPDHDIPDHYDIQLPGHIMNEVVEQEKSEEANNNGEPNNNEERHLIVE